jgi:hypothetical protein
VNNRMTTWRKSSRSTSNAACVELAGDLGAVRDSKNVAGPVLRADLAGLVRAAKEGRLDR